MSIALFYFILDRNSMPFPTSMTELNSVLLSGFKTSRETKANEPRLASIFPLLETV